MQNQRRLIAILVPGFTFLVGILAQIIFDRLGNQFAQNDALIIEITLLAVVMVNVALIIVLSMVFGQAVDERRELFDRFDRMTRRFGLSAEFVEDGPGENGGKTYEATRYLIEKAQRSLFFVDFWVQSHDYHLKDSNTKRRRQEYYDAIITQIEKHASNPGETPFHRRIVQMSDADHKPGADNISADPVYAECLRRSLTIQQSNPKASVLKVAPPYFHTHFAIIDERYVVWPVLTSSPKGVNLKRHGAIIFDDPTGRFVQRLIAVYNMIDAVAKPFEVYHFGPPQDDSTTTPDD